MAGPNKLGFSLPKALHAWTSVAGCCQPTATLGVSMASVKSQAT